MGKYDSKSLHSLENTLGGNRDSEEDAAEGSEGIEEKKWMFSIVLESMYDFMKGILMEK